MWSKTLACAAILGLLLWLPAASVVAAVSPRSVGPGAGTLIIDGTRDLPCGFGNLTINSDESYENAYGWDGLGGGPGDYYGAFAECFQGGSSEVCGVVLDLTSAQTFPWRNIDVFVWADGGGVPGLVLCMTLNVDPGPIALWPDIGRYVIPLQTTCTPGDSWWAGFRGTWEQYYPPAVYIAADLAGSGAGCPFTNIAPGLGYPTGWIPVPDIWGPTNALGIGYYGHAQPSSGVPVRRPWSGEGNWGRVKALYR